MAKVIYSTMRRNDAENQWAFVLSSFPEVEVGEQPIEGPVVVVQPKAGRYIQGDTPLSSFEHPENCTYMFGHDNRNMVEEDLEGLNIHAKVYIDTDGHHEMFSWVAAAIVFWDRRMKNG